MNLSDREISAEIVESCRQGDREAFRALYEAHKDKVYSIALYFFHGDSAAASDATQQVFLKLITSIARFRGESEFSTWLYRMVVNTCMDSTRRGKWREIAAEPDALARVAGVTSNEDDLVRAQTAGKVQAALSSLPPKLRLPILLRYFEDFSYGQMAEALHCSAGTVASRLHKGHRLLAQKLSKMAER